MVSVAVFDEVDGIDQIVLFYDGTATGLQAAQQEARDSVGNEVTLEATAHLEIATGSEHSFCQERGYIG